MARTSAHLALLISVFIYGCAGAEFGWQPHKEYVFSVRGQDVVSLPRLKQQYAGFMYSGELRVQSHSPRVLLVKMLNMNYTKIHEELSGGWWQGPDAEQSWNKTKTLPVTTSTVVVKMTRSTSPELVIQSGLDDWQVNFIKGMVGNLLTYLGEGSQSRQSGNTANHISYLQPTDVFSVMEESVVGRCEVMYEVNRLPRQMGRQLIPNSQLCAGPQDQLWEVTKSRNYSNCQLISEDHSHLPSSDCTPGGANCGQFWTRASITRMMGCGEKNNFVLLSSVSSSSINAQIHLKNNSMASTNSKLNITLLSIQNLKSKFNPPQNKQTLNSLLYSYSTAPKDNGGDSEEDRGESNHQPGSHLEPTNGNDREFEVSPKGNQGSRGKRALRDLKRRFNQHTNEHYQNKQDKSQQLVSSEQSNDHGLNSIHPRNGKRHNHEKHSEEIKNNSKGSKNKHHKSLSNEDSEEQHSEEMKQEEQWKISGKEMKKIPPHQPFNMFTLAHRTSYDLSCLNPKLRQIIADIASDLEEVNILPEKNTMDKLSLAVDICRSLPLDQLTSVGEEVFENRSGADNIMKSNERKVFRDVVTMCGTHPALQLIRGWVERQQVEGEEAAQMIASLPTHIFSPSKYLLQDFFEMVQQIAEKEDKQLTTTGVLALSNLVRQACVNRRVRLHQFSSIVRPVCGDSFSTRVTQWLTRRLDQDNQLSQVYIEALGNIGSPQVIPTLRNVVLSPKYPTCHQAAAVFAMRYQALRKNPEVEPLLMSLYHNYSLAAATRSAAVALLVYTEPGLATWQRLAVATWYEPNPAVSHFISSTIRAMASSKDLHYKDMARKASLVLPLSKPSRVSSHQPQTLVNSWLSSDLQRVVLEQLGWMHFYDFTNFYYRHSSRSSGFSRTNLEASFTSGNFDDLLTDLKELISASRKHSSPYPGLDRTIEKVGDALDLQSRSMPPVQAKLHVKVNNLLERMLVFNKDNIKSWARSQRRWLAEGLTQGKSLSYQKANMDSFHISSTTEMGFPVEFSLRTPWIINARAEINLTNDGLQAGAAFMYSSQLLSSVSVMSAWDNTAHSAGAYATNFIQLPPVRLDLGLDLPLDTVKMTSQYVDQHRLLYFSMQPFTSQRKLKIHQAVLLSPDTIRIKLGEPIQMPISWMSRYLNTVYSSEEKERINIFDYLGQVRGVVGFPMIMPNMEARAFETVMNPLHPIVFNMSLSLASKSNGLLEVQSPKDTIMDHVFNALASAIPEPTPPSYPIDAPPSMAARNADSTHADHHEAKDGQHSGNTNQNDKDNNTDDHKNKPKKESDDDKENKEFSVEQADLMPLSQFQVFSTTYESATGSFNASEIDPFNNVVNGSGRYYLLDKILSKINSGRAVVFGFNMMPTHPDQPTRITAYAAFAQTLSKRVSRVGFFLRKDMSQSKVTAVMECPVDLALDIKRRVSEDLRHNLYLDYVTSVASQETAAFLKGQVGVSRGRLSELRGSSQLEACSQMGANHWDSALDQHCQQLKAQTNELGFGNFTVYYNDNAKPLENLARMYLDAAKVMLPRTEERSGEGHNTMNLIFDMNQRLNTVSSHITTPATSLYVRRLPLRQLPATSLLEWATQENAPSEYCGLSTKRVRTFDGADFTYHMKESWHLVTYDCTGKYPFSIIAQTMEGNHSMRVEVNVEDQFVVLLEEGPKVYVNARMLTMDANNALLQLRDGRGREIGHIVYTPDSAVHIQLPNEQVDIVYTGSSLIIKGENHLQGRLCGLCGSYSKTNVEQFLTARGSRAKSSTDFATSYKAYTFNPDNKHHNKKEDKDEQPPAEAA